MQVTLDKVWHYLEQLIAMLAERARAQRGLPVGQLAPIKAHFLLPLPPTPEESREDAKAAQTVRIADSVIAIIMLIYGISFFFVDMWVSARVAADIGILSIGFYITLIVRSSSNIWPLNYRTPQGSAFTNLASVLCCKLNHLWPTLTCQDTRQLTTFTDFLVQFTILEGDSRTHYLIYLRCNRLQVFL